MKLTKEKVVKNETELKEVFVLWKNKSKTGLDYLTGQLSNEEKTKITGFYNTNKKNPQEPDIRIYVSDNDNTNVEVAALWETITKNEKRILTGSTNEKEKLIAFYSKDNDEKKPYIRTYYKQD